MLNNGLAILINNVDQFRVVGQAHSGRMAIDMTQQLHPDIIIMDVTMPDLNGIDATSQICRDFPHVKVLGLSMHSKRQIISDMLKAGAKGYVLKEDMFDNLINALQTINRDEIYLSSKITGILVKDYVKQLKEDEKSANDFLNSRERHILQMLSEGFSSKHIASTLHVSVKTIEANRRQIMQKLKINNIAELTKFAIREGISKL